MLLETGFITHVVEYAMLGAAESRNIVLAEKQSGYPLDMKCSKTLGVG